MSDAKQTVSRKKEDGSRSSTLLNRKEHALKPPQASTVNVNSSHSPGVYRQDDGSSGQADATPIARHEALQHAYGNQFVASRKHIQRSSDPGGSTVSGPVESAIDNKRGSGQAMDHATQNEMSNSFGTDFSGVRVHDDPESHELNRSLNARAFTTGSDVFFGENEYQPNSGEGNHLLAHELTHVVQQGGDGLSPKRMPGLQAQMEVSKPGDPLELEADQMADQVTGNGSPGAAGVPPDVGVNLAALGHGGDLPAMPKINLKESDYSGLSAAGDHGKGATTMIGRAAKISRSPALSPQVRSSQAQRKLQSSNGQSSALARAMPLFRSQAPLIQRAVPGFNISRLSDTDSPSPQPAIMRQEAEAAPGNEGEGEEYYFTSPDDHNIPETYDPDITSMLDGLEAWPEAFTYTHYDKDDLGIDIDDFLDNPTEDFATQIQTLDQEVKSGAPSKPLEDFLKAIAVMSMIVKGLEFLLAIPFTILALAIVIAGVMIAVGIPAAIFGSMYPLIWGLELMVWAVEHMAKLITNKWLEIIGYIMFGFKEAITLMRTVAVFVMLSEGVDPDAIKDQTKTLSEDATDLMVSGVMMAAPDIKTKGGDAGDAFAYGSVPVKGVFGGTAGGIVKGVNEEDAGAGALKGFTGLTGDFGGVYGDAPGYVDPWKNVTTEHKENESAESELTHEEQSEDWGVGVDTSTSSATGDRETIAGDSELAAIQVMVLEAEAARAQTQKSLIDADVAAKTEWEAGLDAKKQSIEAAKENYDKAAAVMDTQIKSGDDLIKAYEDVIKHLIITEVMVGILLIVAVAAAVRVFMGDASNAAKLGMGLGWILGVSVPMAVILGIVIASHVKADEKKKEAEDSKAESERLKDQVIAAKTELETAEAELLEIEESNQAEIDALGEVSTALQTRLEAIAAKEDEVDPAGQYSSDVEVEVEMEAEAPAEPA